MSGLCRAGERDDLRYTVLVKRVAYWLMPAVLAIGVVLTGGCRPDAGPASSAGADGPPDALLVERLAIAYGALRQAGGARRIDESHRNAQAAIDALVGPGGRHGKRYAPAGSVLPGEGENAELGLALRAYDSALEGGLLRPAIDGQVTAAIDDWRTPAARYDAIDAAVAQVQAGRAAAPALSGAVDSALAWALLSLQSTDAVEARVRAERGAGHLHTALDAVRRARIAGT